MDPWQKNTREVGELATILEGKMSMAEDFFFETAEFVS